MEGNTFGRIGHQSLVFSTWNGTSEYNVIRDNTFQQTWHTGLCIQGGSTRNLVEHNRFYDTGNDYLNDPDPASLAWSNPAIQHENAETIFRFNIFDGNQTHISLTEGNQINDEADYNKFYHNRIEIKTI